MSATGRPWWASDPADTHVGTDDPVAQHRAARRGNAADGAQASRSDADRGPSADCSNEAEHDAVGCGICPFCAGTRWLQATRPEVFEHVREAAQHLTLAAKAFLDRDGHASTAEGDGIDHAETPTGTSADNSTGRPATDRCGNGDDHQ